MTGMISGSSIANTVTTELTIPIMKNWIPQEKAGAIEVSSSVNGQIMPPVMGAAAFVMAVLSVLLILKLSNMLFYQLSSHILLYFIYLI